MNGPAAKGIHAPVKPLRDSETAQNDEDALAALKALSEVGAVMVALAFVSGWSYLASYYTSFGLNPFDLDFSIPATAAFSVHMVTRSPWLLVLIGASFLLAILAYWRLKFMRRVWASASIAGLLFAVAILGSWRGKSLAAEDMFDTSRRLPNVGFITKTKASGPDCLSAGTTDCKLLLHAKGFYYFFIPITGATPAAIKNKNLEVYAVSESEIASAKIERGL